MKKLFAIVTIWAIIGCASMATYLTPKKKVAIANSDISKQANSFFWHHFHAGNYDSIPAVIEQLHAALNNNPSDLITTAHLGFVHTWALAERQQLAVPYASVSEHVFLGKKYFEDAYQLNHQDPRILGFLAAITLTEGTILKNSKSLTKGYFLGLRSIRQWPQFNKFTLGYLFSNLPTADKKFHQGLQWQYETINDCACQSSSKSSLSLEKKSLLIKQSTNKKILRACWNTWIAPHNWEGFCMNFGDMLVKNNQIEEAKKIYALAAISDTYNDWVYKPAMELRIKNATENTRSFNANVDEVHLKQQNVLMFNSSMACGACHKMSTQEMVNFGNKEPGLEYYFLKKAY